MSGDSLAGRSANAPVSGVSPRLRMEKQYGKPDWRLSRPVALLSVARRLTVEESRSTPTNVEFNRLTRKTAPATFVLSTLTICPRLPPTTVRRHGQGERLRAETFTAR